MSHSSACHYYELANLLNKHEKGFSNIKVSHKDKTGSTVELMEGELCWEINKEESMWNLVPGEHMKRVFY
jgi:hypothetical protein